MPAEDIAHGLQLLTQVTAELAAADTLDAVVDAAVNHAADALGAAVTTLMLCEGPELLLVGGRGLQSGVQREWASFKLTDNTPASEAARTGEPVLVATGDELEQRFPPLRGRGIASRSTLCLPLGANPATIGALGMTFEQCWLPGPQELAFLRQFADACALAVRRVRAAAQAAMRERQLRFLADVSFELGRSLDYHTTLSRVAELVVPDLADWCSVQVVDDAGELVTLAVAHVDPAKVAWAWELQKQFPSPQDAPTGAPAVVRSGTSELYPDISDDLLVSGARTADELRLLRDLRMRSAIVVPLKGRDRTFGAITLIRTGETARRYSPDELAIAEDVGRRAGMAIDNAHLHSQTRDVALQLQHAVLPDLPAAPPGWQLAAHYEPSSSAEVGGDFFDVIPLPDGRLAIVVGDVMGHGLPAAAAMAQIRAAIRGFASDDPDPARVIDRLQTMFVRLTMTRMVSVIYGVADGATHTVDLVNAGAMPPVLIGSDGRGELLPIAPRAALGADPEPTVSTTWPLPPGHTLLLYTDGLVERRDQIIDIGFDRLRAVAGQQLGSGELPDALTAVVEAVRDPSGRDDVTALAVRCA